MVKNSLKLGDAYASGMPWIAGKTSEPIRRNAKP